MSGVAKTLDKGEDKGRKNLWVPGTEILAAPAETKRQYADKRGFETDGEGYAGAKEKHEIKEAEKAAAAATAKAEADAKAKSDSELAAATEKSHAAQRQALKRKGRRASILTSSQGTDQLGLPG